MDRDGLERELRSRGVDPTAYSLTGGHGREAYCLDQLPLGRWRTYFCERGLERDVQVFGYESLACAYFLDWVMQDSMVFASRDDPA